MKKIKLIFLYLFFLLLPNNQINAQDEKASSRLKIIKEFVSNISEGLLPNKQIVKKYVVQGRYFENDTVKKIANDYLNSLRGLKNREVAILKYSEIEKTFEVSGVHEFGDNSDNPAKLIFSLFISNSRQTSKVDLNDLYVIKEINKNTRKLEEGGIFILFREDNRIISFAGTTIGNKTNLIQF
jgi:hypothetical protein